MKSDVLDLVGGRGERPPSANDPVPEKEWVAVLTEARLAGATDKELLAVYRDLMAPMIEGDPNLAMVRRELRRRKLMHANALIGVSRSMPMGQVVPFAPRP